MKTDTAIVALLLAAGSGTRFGGDKLLHPLADGTPLAAHAARRLREAGLAVTAVVRAADARLRAVLLAEGCVVTECPDAAAGMGHSLAHGVRATPDAAGWLVALGDMPSIRPATIAAVAAAVAGGASMAAPRHRGERGHPVGFAARHHAELARLSGDAGARQLMHTHRAAVTMIDVDDPGVLYDVDRKTDLV